MGASQSVLREGQQHGSSSAAAQQRPCTDKASSSVARRIQLLEELCAQQTEPGRRAEVLKQLAGSQNNGQQQDSPNVLTDRPREFQPGELIAAGSYGRVYEGTYAGQPAALKLLLLDEETAHAILNEVRLCLKLNHTNLVQLLDCAVVASHKLSATSDGQVPASPAFPGQHHQILPVFGGGGSSSPATPSTSCPYSYLPIVSGQAGFSTPGSQAQLECSSKAAAAVSHASTELVPHDSRAVPAALLGYSCFEVWIAMELCDGGTLAHQLQSGFHCLPGSQQIDMEALLHIGLDIGRALAYMHRENVCHGDLKTENVLLKSISPESAAEMQRQCSTCGSTCSHDDCTWLGMLCSSSMTSNSYASRCCCSCSGDSCWSCYSRSMGGMDHSDSSSPDSLSTTSSNASAPNTERRSRAGFKGSHLLYGLCCMGSPTSCATEDDVYAGGDGAMRGCFPCSCGVMSLEPSAHDSTYGPPPPAAEHPRQPMRQALTAADVGNCVPDVQQLSLLVPVLMAPAAAPSSATAGPASVHRVYEALITLPPPIQEGQEQVLQCPPLLQLPSTAPHAVGGLPDSNTGVDETPEEEHVAPLSLYTQARQRRRSRSFPHGVVMPAALAAAAAAAAAAASAELPLGHAPPGSSYGSGSSSGGSDDEQHSANHCIHALRNHGRPAQSLLQSTLEGNAARDGMLADPAAGKAVGPAARSRSSSSQHDAAEGWLGRHDAVGHMSQFGPVRPQACHDVYAHSMMLPPVPHKARRHSYCYGTSASYSASVLSFSRGAGVLHGARSLPSGGISATQAATAIAAAAEAVRHGSSRPAERRSHRNRRMSWDDRLFRQSPARGSLSSFLGGALPGFSRLGWEATSEQPAAAAAAGPPRRRTRRHSWAGYLQPDALAGAGSHGWGPPLPAGMVAGHGLHQQQSVCAASMGAGAAAAADRGYDPIPSSRGGRKARRHSWAGYGLEHSSVAIGSKLSGLRALSSCFAAVEDAAQQPYGMQTSPQRHLFSLPQFPGCCGESCLRPLDDDADEVDGSRHGLLEAAAPRSAFVGASPSECLLLSGNEADGAARSAAAVGCFGKWSSSTNSSATSCVSGRQRNRRRYSWCCGAGSEAELWADLNHDDSSSQLGLLSGEGQLSVPLLPEAGHQHRNRRCSWDGYRYRQKLSQNWGRKAASIDAQVSTPDSWRSQQLSSVDSPVGFPAGLLLRTSSDAAAHAKQGSIAAGLVAAVPRLQGQAALYLEPQGADSSTSLGAASSNTPQQPRHTAAEVMQLLSLPPSSSNSPAANNKDSKTPDTAIASSSPPSTAPGEVAPVAQVDQFLLEPKMSLAPAIAGVKSSRVQVSLEQPVLPLSPPVQLHSQVLQQQQPAEPVASAVCSATGHVSLFEQANPFAAGFDSTAACRRDVVPAGPWQDLQQQHAPAAGSNALAECAAVAAAAGPVVMQQQSILSSSGQVAQQQQGTAGMGSIAGWGGSEATAAAGAAALEASLLEPFTGSFTLHSRSSCTPRGAAAGDTSAINAGSGRGRRWSTGVTAHQLLFRQQLLDACGSELPAVTEQAAGQLGPFRASTAGPSAGLGSVVDAGQQQQTPAAAAWGPVRDVPANVPAGSFLMGTAAGTHLDLQQTDIMSSTNASTAINVLGMPRQPMAVMSQRRLSYDTATGLYRLVAGCGNHCGLGLNQLPLQEAQQRQQELLVGPQQQQQQQQQGLAQAQAECWQQRAPLQPAWASALQQGSTNTDVAGVQDLSAEGVGCSAEPCAAEAFVCAEGLSHDEQLQQHCQAQMQRLLAALAKKGYGGLQDPDSASGTGQQPAAAAPAPAAAVVPCRVQPSISASLQHQAEVAQEVAPLPPRRYCAKVCDFGFSKCLRAGQSHCSTASAGTITHQAPEVLRHGHLSPAADIYAFGIIMWELLTCDRPFRGLLEGDLVVGVCDRGLRPVFPPGCPASYVALAQQCWSDDPAVRPTAAQLLKRLNELLYEERRAQLRASAGATGLPKDGCRQRRHSMPLPGYKQRRRSRRMSVFLLPFTRPPAVPEDAPLDQQAADDWRGTVSGSHSCAASQSAAASKAPTSTDKATPSACATADGANMVPLRLRFSHLQRASGGFSSRSHAVGAGEPASAPGSSARNVGASAGGLLSSSSTLSRLRGLVGGSGPCSAPNAAGHAVPAASSASDGTEWFQSF